MSITPSGNEYEEPRINLEQTNNFRPLDAYSISKTGNDIIRNKSIHVKNVQGYGYLIRDNNLYALSNFSVIKEGEELFSLSDSKFDLVFSDQCVVSVDQLKVLSKVSNKCENSVVRNFTNSDYVRLQKYDYIPSQK